MSQIRVTFRMNEVNHMKLEEMANRYGMSVNSLVSFIVGQWLDNNYDMKDRVIDKMTQEAVNGPKLAELIGTDAFSSMMKEIITEMAQREAEYERNMG